MSLSRVVSIVLSWNERPTTDSWQRRQRSLKTWKEAEDLWRRLALDGHTDVVGVSARWANGLVSISALVDTVVYQNPALTGRAANRGELDALRAEIFRGGLHKFFTGTLESLSAPHLKSARAANARQLLLRCAFTDEPSGAGNDEAAFSDVSRAVREFFPDRADEILRRVEQWRASSEKAPC